MGKVTHLGWLKEDDPIFTGGYTLSSHPAFYGSKTPETPPEEVSDDEAPAPESQDSEHGNKT
ncbi:hypothetical protein OAJ60_04150 [Planctomycetaceae bacterium]|nr:hypothetical protein [Planctomycetaceae bacterium]